MGWKFFLEDKNWAGVQNLRIMRGGYNATEVVQPFVFKKHERGAFIPDDEIAIIGTRELEEDGGFGAMGFLQAAMDCAWENGIRPKALEDQRNELKAVREHLADMRALTFKTPMPGKA